MPQQAALPLKIAIATYGHTAALKQGLIPRRYTVDELLSDVTRGLGR